jgi:hypothetical protein
LLPNIAVLTNSVHETNRRKKKKFFLDLGQIQKYARKVFLFIFPFYVFNSSAKILRFQFQAQMFRYQKRKRNAKAALGAFWSEVNGKLGRRSPWNRKSFNCFQGLFVSFNNFPIPFFMLTLARYATTVRKGNGIVCSVSAPRSPAEFTSHLISAPSFWVR